MDKLFLIDASGFLFRAYFAIQGLSGKSGESTGALFGFIRSYLLLKDQFQPNYLVCIFDGERSKESRTKIYAEYKAHRRETPPDLIKQIDEAEHLVDLLGIPMLSIAGVEADDTIASVTRWAREKNSEVFISTSDKDLAQLVDSKVKLINPHKGNLIVDESKVYEMFSVKPHQIVDYLAICGDQSDNIPGIAGFGPKTASQLLNEYGSLEKILENKDKFSGKKREVLEKEEENARLSKRLASLDFSVQFPHEDNFFKLKEPNWEKLSKFFDDKNFTSLMKIIPKEFLHRDVLVPKGQETKYHIIEDKEILATVLAKLEKSRDVAIDTETTSEHPMIADLVGVGLSCDESDAYYIPLNGKLLKEDVISSLKKFIEEQGISFFGHNIKYDMHVFENEGIYLRNISFDTIIASYLLNSHERRHSLTDLSLDYFGKKKIEISELIGKGKSAITMDKVPIEKVGNYCCEDVEYTLRLKKTLEKQINERKLNSLCVDIEIPLITVLEKMERKGIFVDCDLLKKLSTDVTFEIDRVEKEIFHLAGEEFNVNSPKQLGSILFEKLQIPPPFKGKDQMSTRAEVLEVLANNHVIAGKILEYRSYEKLRSTYIDALPDFINPKTGRVHCQFNQSVAATGRLACQDPNLQNIPIRTELGRKIREAFRPEKPGWSYLSADYSQVELRLLAHFSEDPDLLSAFSNNIDVHAATASKLFGVSVEEVTAEMRRKAKAVNFGVVYGQQSFGLSQELQITFKEAAQFIEEFYKKHPRVKEYLENIKEQARKDGGSVTLTGRERKIPEINSTNSQLRTQAERLAVNTPLQGTAADIIKIAMLNIDKWLKKENMQSFLILQIHDELLFEAPDNEILSLQKGVASLMENVFTLKVPLAVEIAIGKNWKEC